MKVKELIKKLKKLDQESEIIMASDPEGNDYVRNIDIGHGMMNKHELESYFLFYGVWPDGHSYEDWFGDDDGKDDYIIPCVVFYP